MVHHLYVRSLPAICTAETPARLFGHEGHQDVLLAHCPADLCRESRRKESGILSDVFSVLSDKYGVRELVLLSL